MEYIIFPRKPLLTKNQIKRLANIFDNAGQVILAVVVLSPIISGFDRVNVFVVLSGIVGMGACWALSLFFERRVE